MIITILHEYNANYGAWVKLVFGLLYVHLSFLMVLTVFVFCAIQKNGPGRNAKRYFLR